MLHDQLRRRVERYIEPRVPAHLRARHRSIGSADRATLVESLTRHFFRGDTAYLGTPAGSKDIHEHLDGRIGEFREHVVPWLDAALPLDGARILEIGCGTGSSTVAMAEQRALVTGIDIDAAGIEVAKLRCALYRTPAEFLLVNAVDAHTELAGRDFDFVIFFATLEHMTLDERFSAMASAWKLVGPGKCWCVIDTPNRLWIRDGHTSLLPFFHWLPDELAIRYMRHSPESSTRCGTTSRRSGCWSSSGTGAG